MEDNGKSKSLLHIGLLWNDLFPNGQTTISAP